jgi:TPR repeat protein
MRRSHLRLLGAFLAFLALPALPLACGATTKPVSTGATAPSSSANASSSPSAAAAPSASASASSAKTDDLSWVIKRCEDEPDAITCSFAGSLTRDDPAKAARFFRRACTLAVKGCTEAAGYLRIDKPALKDAALLLDLLDEACARGADGEECRDVGRTCVKPPYGADAIASRCEGLEAACEKAPRRCVAAATYAWNREGDRPTLDARALAFAQKGCAAGVAAACRQITGMAITRLVGEEGHAKDVAWATATLDKQCASGELGGCRALGRAYDVGRGVARDRAKARALHDKACAKPGLACDGSMFDATEALVDWDAKTFAAAWDRLTASCKTAREDCPLLEALVDRFAASAPAAERVGAKERYHAVAELEGPRVWRALTADWGSPESKGPFALEPTLAWMKKACAAGAPRACEITACSDADKAARELCVSTNGSVVDRVACDKARATERSACKEP